MNENTRIIVIDDDPGIRDAYQRILTPLESGGLLSESAELFGDSTQDTQPSQQKQYELTLASSGEEGVKVIQEALDQGKPFAIAFVDMKMAGIDGAETAKRILSIDPRIKIVTVTAYTDYKSEELLTIAGQGDLCFFRKPFTHKEITELAGMLTVEWRQESGIS